MRYNSFIFFVGALLEVGAVSLGAAGVTIWPSNSTPVVVSENDPSAVELGVRFRADLDGYVSAIRFYKGSGNTGPHVGNLWTSSGTLLSTVTFTGETASGWQEQTLSNPVLISSNTTYVVSYHAPAGFYSVDDGYFSGKGATNPPLRALVDGEDGPNGVYLYGGSAFPVNTFQSGNYWVDLVFQPAATSDTNAPTIANALPTAGVVTSLTQITVTFSEPVAGVQAADLLVNGNPATGLGGTGSTYTFSFPEPPFGTVFIAWDSGHGITDLALPANPFDETASESTWQYELVDITPPVVAELYPPADLVVSILSQIEVTFSEDVQGVDASDLLINGLPASQLTQLPGQPYVFGFSQPSTGAVNVAWIAGHGITDNATPPNPFGGGAWSYTLDTNAPNSDLLINEFLAADLGSSGLTDEDGELQDWIEIYNQGTNPVDLASWALSDDPSLPGLWVFPARTLNPGEYLVVFASAKDRKPTSGELHTNFKLAVGGEPLGLYTPDSPRTLASGFVSFPEQRNDISYGNDSGGQLRYFAVPTPGGPNGVSTIVGVVEPLHANVSRGHFKTPFLLTLSSPTVGATLRYTTDGSEPTEGSPQFPSPLAISDTTLFRAAGFKTNFLPSKTITHSYLFNLPAELRALPVLSVVTASNNIYGPSGILGIDPPIFATNEPRGIWLGDTNLGDYHNPSLSGLAWERPASVEWIVPEDHSGFQVDCGLRVHGGSWYRPRIQPDSKVSLRLVFRSDYGPGRLNYPLFPLTSIERFDKVVVRGGMDDQDNPFIVDEVIRRLAHDMGQLASYGSLTIVLVNGVYHTNSPYFNPCERIDRKFFQEHLGGSEAYDVVRDLGDPVIDGVRTDFQNMHDFIVNSANVNDPADYAAIGNWLDLTNFADYCLLNSFAAVGDWVANNWRAGRDQAGGLWRFVCWDAEYGFGNENRSVDLNVFELTGGGDDFSGLASINYSEIARIYQELRGSSEFQLLWADRVQKHFFNGGALTGGSVSNRFEELQTELSGLITNMNTTALDWAQGRQPFFFAQMDAEGLMAPLGAPDFSQFGGRVPPGFSLTLTHTNGTNAVYYTLDGTDPRVPFSGGVASNAVAYTGPVPINSTLQVKARVRQDDSTWSAVTEATFTYAALGSPLRITEIMYNPVGGSIYEFVELQNTSASAIDLAGMYFGGIGFTFPGGTTLAGGALVVIGSNTDTNSWVTRYPGVSVAGWFAGNLSNGGERLELFEADGRLVVSVDYSDGGGWPEAADGLGRSLELVDPNGDPDDPANWQASASADGTPSATNSAPPATTVLLSEIMAENLTAVNHSGTYPDWIELHNPAGAGVDISGWSLTDDGNERKFVFPGGTTVASNGFLVVWCDSATNTTPGLHSDFQLNNGGETVSLFDATTNRVEAMSFGVQIADYSVGRIGGEWMLNNPTPDALNSAAAIASATNLTINEWMADALPGQDDWLEIFNQSTTLPASLQGVYLATSNDLHRLHGLSFLQPLGHVQLRADNGVGPDHLDFKLPAAGDQIVLYDNTGEPLDLINYPVQTEGISEGRLPDGSATLMSFPGTASPAAANYVLTYSGPVINEVLARNQSVLLNGQAVDFVELHNSGPSTFDFSGMSLSVNSPEPWEWVFPAGTTLDAGAFLVIKCDGASVLSTNVGDFNTGESLDGESGGVHLFNASAQVVDSVQYGLQIRDLSIGLSAGQWRLLDSPTPGAANDPPATLGATTSLHLNEWMGDNTGGADWFELYNPLSLPVDLSLVSLTDDPSIVGESKFLPSPLSFIAASGFVKWVADGSPGQGLNHVNFSLDAQGDSLLVYDVVGTNITPIDAVAFGAQAPDLSAGSLPDGSGIVFSFPGSATPADSNYRLLTEVVVNEILTHTDPPFEDAVELYNPGPSVLDVGRWYLSNSRDNFKKYQIAPGTTIPAGGHAVLYEYQFNDGSSNAFGLNSAHGDEVWLSKADTAGNETYDRVVVEVGAAFNGVPIGPVTTSVGVDYAPLDATTFGVDNPASLAEFRSGTGAVNAGPIVGPVILNEIFYNPPGGTNGTDEYVELYNNSGSSTALYDPAYPTNRWKLGGGVDFTFPAGVTLAPGGYALVVEFDPADSIALASFRALYGLSTNGAIYGPFSGKLDNDADDVELYQPDTPQSGPPDAGFVPYVRVDRVSYTDAVPWPAGGVDGGGLSLQRSSSVLYGNEPLHWFEAVPTPGASNDPLQTDTDGDGIPDLDELAMGLNPNNAADAALDPDLDGMSNLAEYLAGTDHIDPDSNLKLTGSVVGGEMILSFEAVSNRTYSVLYQTILGDASWIKLWDVASQPASHSASLTNTVGPSQQFYRVVTPALP